VIVAVWVLRVAAGLCAIPGLGLLALATALDNFASEIDEARS
jgi:hypothetical protein